MLRGACRAGGSAASHARAHARWAQHAGYWTSTNFLKEVDRIVVTTYYDSVTGLPLFIAPRGRTFAAFEAESRSHGWPSFRDAEVRCVCCCLCRRG